MDITKDNFVDILPEVLSSIKSAAFVSIDTEFTGIVTDPSVKNTYFDSGASLYEKKRNSLKHISILQFGLSTFKGVRDSNTYDVKTFNFYIRPHHILSIDPAILCQVSGLEFLQANKFDFNKWLYEGIPCLNHEDEESVRKLYASILAKKEFTTTPYEVLDTLEEVRLWIDDLKGEDTMNIDVVNATNTLVFFSLVHERFKSVVASLDSTKITLTKVEKSIQPKMAEEESVRALNLIISQLKGFTSVIDCLAQAEIPLVLHNGFTDLLLLHKQFYRELPKRFDAFLSNIHELFPVIYDTKELAYTLMSLSKSTERFDLDFLSKTSLPSVKSNLEKESIAFFRPTIKHNELTKKYDNDETFYHEAGFDALTCGYCFLHMSHIHSMMKCTDARSERPLSSRELVYSLSSYKNKIPVQQSGVKYISFDGTNKNVEQYNWLIVEPRSVRITLTPSVVSSHLSKFGRVDVRPWHKRAVLVATARKPISDEIVRAFRGNTELKITRYHSLKHSPVVRSLAFTCGLVSTGLSTWFIYNTVRKGKLW